MSKLPRPETSKIISHFALLILYYVAFEHSLKSSNWDIRPSKSELQNIVRHYFYQRYIWSGTSLSLPVFLFLSSNYSNLYLTLIHHLFLSEKKRIREARLENRYFTSIIDAFLYRLSRIVVIWCRWNTMTIEWPMLNSKNLFSEG